MEYPLSPLVGCWSFYVTFWAVLYTSPIPAWSAHSAPRHRVSLVYSSRAGGCWNDQIAVAGRGNCLQSPSGLATVRPCAALL